MKKTLKLKYNSVNLNNDVKKNIRVKKSSKKKRKKSQMVIYVDIDQTICQTKGTNYKNSKPIKDNIKKINKLYKDGNKIIYWTARGTRSGLNHFHLTYKQLKKWKCKFHELRMGKPYYDLFIDDKNLNAILHFKNENINKILS